MKETIYTVPLTEVMEQNPPCLFCTLQEQEAQKQLDYCLGAAMMEPDHREESNKRGYCGLHTKKMTEKSAALSLALIADTRGEYVLEQVKNARDNEKKQKKLFGKKNQKNELSEVLRALAGSCLICERIGQVMEKYMETFRYLCRTDNGFEAKVLQGNGVCLSHLADLMQSPKSANGFKNTAQRDKLLDFFLSCMESDCRNNKDFIAMFDYRADKQNNTVPKNAYILWAQRIAGKRGGDL